MIAENDRNTRTEALAPSVLSQARLGIPGASAFVWGLHPHGWGPLRVYGGAPCGK